LDNLFFTSCLQIDQMELPWISCLSAPQIKFNYAKLGTSGLNANVQFKYATVETVLLCYRSVADSVTYWVSVDRATQ